MIPSQGKVISPVTLLKKSPFIPKGYTAVARTLLPCLSSSVNLNLCEVNTLQSDLRLSLSGLDMFAFVYFGL